MNSVGNNAIAFTDSLSKKVKYFLEPTLACWFVRILILSVNADKLMRLVHKSPLIPNDVTLADNKKEKHEDK